MPKKNQPLGKRDPDRHKKTAAGVADRAHAPGQTRPRGGIRPGTSWQTQNRFTVLAVCGLLLLAVGLVFGQTVQHKFVNFDDNTYVYENAQVARGLTVQGIVWAFTTGHASNWHPLTWLSHMLDCQLYGLHAGGHHLTNVLLHAVNAILLFLVLWRMTGDLWPGAFVAAVFAIHPLHVESVAWVAERKDVLSGLFFLLTLAAYLGYVRHPFSLARYLTVVVLFALGLMAKPMLVTLPFVMLLLDYWPLERWAGSCTATPGTNVQLSSQRRSSFPWRLVVEKIPLLLLTAASCVVTPLFQNRTVALLDALPMSWRIANAQVAYVAYLRQLFYPVGLAVFYPHPRGDLPIWEVVGAFVLLTSISAGALAWRRRFPYLFVGWLWYLGMLVPVFGLLQVGLQAMADRYTYLAQIGLYIVLAWGTAQVCRSWPHRRWVWGIASALVVVGLMGCAWQQTRYWHDSETLWTHALACTSKNFSAHYNLGHALAGQGRLEEAIVQYEKALEINPDYAEAHNGLGAILVQRGRLDEAIMHYRKALALQPGYADAHSNLGNSLASRGQLDEAIAHYQKALELMPEFAAAHNNLGMVLASRGQVGEAIAHYQKAVEINPELAEVHYNLGMALNQQGKVFDAVTHWREAARLQPSQVIPLNQLAWVLATSPEASIRNGPEAVELARRAVELSGGREPAVLGTLAAAAAEAGRFSEAVEAAERAVSLASARGDQAMTNVLDARIKLYRAGSPYHETRSLPPGKN